MIRIVVPLGKISLFLPCCFPHCQTSLNTLKKKLDVSVIQVDMTVECSITRMFIIFTQYCLLVHISYKYISWFLAFSKSDTGGQGKVVYVMWNCVINLNN